MTPFGARLRALRKDRGVTQAEMAQALALSPAYLSALEHGRRGLPSPGLLRQICAYFGMFWEEAEDLERLARLSDPRVVVDTAGLSPEATALANELAARIGTLDPSRIEALRALLAGPGKMGPENRGAGKTGPGRRAGPWEEITESADPAHKSRD